MAFRLIWATFFLAFFLIMTGKLVGILSLLSNYRTSWLLIFASLMIGINQFGFIYSISVEQVLQASFAYFIFPLMAVFLGFLFLGEKFSRIQLIALVLALSAVIFLAMGLGNIPYISILLGVTFSIYGLIKKTLGMDPLRTVSIEIFVLFPIAMGYLIFLIINSPEIFASMSKWDFYMFAASGLITGVPLFLFSLSTYGLKYSTVGLVNYLNPTLQFLVAVLIFSEPFSFTHGVSFCLIWISLFLYSSDSIRADVSKSKNISSTD